MCVNFNGYPTVGIVAIGCDHNAFSLVFSTMYSGVSQVFCVYSGSGCIASQGGCADGLWFYSLGWHSLAAFLECTCFHGSQAGVWVWV